MTGKTGIIFIAALEPDGNDILQRMIMDASCLFIHRLAV